MKTAASARDLTVGVIMILAALVYLVGFVPGGWVPHDEGMLGQSADRVLHGGIPHVDYDEPYTGGLTWLYAGVFKVAGVDLLNVRWLLFMAAVAAVSLTYAVIRRFLGPIGSAFATWVAVGWSFPNYFAALPSWWLLLCSLLCVWAVIRHAETGSRRWLLVAGLSAGLAVAVKQTGVYLVAALVFTLLYDSGRPASDSTPLARLERVVRWSAGLVSIVAVASILRPRLLQAEGLYLFVPTAACATALVVPLNRVSEPSAPRSALASITIALVAAAVPLVLLLIPYMSRDRLWDLANGLVVLPRKRLAFASVEMPSARFILTGMPLAALLFVKRCRNWAAGSRIAQTLLWSVAILLPVLALRHGASYQAVWQSARAFAALAPIGICWRLMSGDVEHAGQRTVLFTMATTLAWMSLNQFPFAAPIYFSYVAPLAVVTAVAWAATNTPFSRATMMPWAVMLLLFAVLITNRGDLYTLGLAHTVRPREVRLNLPRAHLRVSDGDVATYGRLVGTIGARLHGGRLIAGPDCPEVYFLLGLFNPSGELFDFFSGAAIEEHEQVETWSKADVIVVNHAPQFSPAPSEQLLTFLHREFTFGQQIGHFEVRWR
jgi:hypothetical protein